MNYLEINNLTGKEIPDLDLLKQVLLFALQKENLDQAFFSVIFVDNNYIHNLNKTYRNIDRATDVITFALEDETNTINGSNIRILGDIYISLDKAEEQATTYKHSLKREICFLAVHGLYHLLGYDHMTKEDEQVMFKKQDEILEHFDIPKYEV